MVGVGKRIDREEGKCQEEGREGGRRGGGKEEGGEEGSQSNMFYVTYIPDFQCLSSSFRLRQNSH